MKITEGSKVQVITSMGYNFIGTVATVVNPRTLWVVHDYKFTMHVLDLDDVKVCELIEGGY
ncbi:gp178 [Bacillus phage W.Ph.]|uniref:Gp178 n=1 Tax=Bacillus phage W.Ph. TaxID=764595 RepID=G9B1S9_9CAUD|nr:gp178 [Bacillus phage W.Ph.]ADH03324.1 gp178 [Bacillus phage W.Ph.]